MLCKALSRTPSDKVTRDDGILLPQQFLPFAQLAKTTKNATKKSSSEIFNRLSSPHNAYLERTLS